jgi:Predicted signal transduction protein with a C-terminal ATPase domain
LKLIKSMSFRYKIFWSCLIIALIPMFVHLITIQNMRHTLNRNLKQEGNFIIAKEEAQLEGINELCSEIIHNIEMSDILLSKYKGGNDNDVYLHLYHEAQKLPIDSNINIYNKYGIIEYSTNNKINESEFSVEWGKLKKAIDSESIVYYSESKNMQYNYNSVVSILKAVYNINENLIGFIEIELSRSSLLDIFKLTSKDSMTLYFADAYGRVLYSSLYNVSEEVKTDIRQMCKQTTASKTIEKGNNIFYVSKEFVSGYYIIIEQSMEAYQTIFSTAQILTGIGLMIAMLLCLVLSGFLSGFLFRPILQREKDLNEVHIKMLQAQLNPHFLYNTLDTVKWLAKINNITEIANIAEEFAVILRKSISNKKLVTLMEELKLVESYVAIQKIRFSNRFTYEVQVSDELLEYEVPKLILQPLVENAIIHGFEEQENGNIVINITEEPKKKKLIITVTDNGKGMDLEVVKAINNNQVIPTKGHLGLYNVNKIIKLHYERDLGLNVSSEIGVGTIITITL